MHDMNQPATYPNMCTLRNDWLPLDGPVIKAGSHVAICSRTLEELDREMALNHDTVSVTTNERDFCISAAGLIGFPHAQLEAWRAAKPPPSKPFKMVERLGPRITMERFERHASAFIAAQLTHYTPADEADAIALVDRGMWIAEHFCDELIHLVQGTKDKNT